MLFHSRTLKPLRIRQIGSVAALFGLYLALPAAAQDRGGSPAFAPETIQKQIAYLASDALQGRGSGEPGNAKAAQYIAAEFARCGLKPLGTSQQQNPNALTDGSGYFQPFRFRAGRVVGKGSLLESNTLDGKHESRFRLHKDFEPSSISSGGVVRGEVVFVSYGIRAPQAGHDDYANLEVKSRIVLLLAGSPGDPHGPLADFADIRRKALTARELGATAVLVALPKDSPLATPAAREFSESDAGLPVLRVTSDVALTLMGEKNTSFLEQMSGKEAPVGVRLVADVKPVEKVTANVVGMIPGSDPTLKSEYLVIGAHLDHLGMGGPGSLAKSSAPAIHHGADDNASGSAGVMALARFFGDYREGGTLKRAQIRQRPRRSLVLICFSGEELGLLGSDFYSNHPLVPLDKTVAMLNMDMIGRLRDNKLIAIGSGTAKEWDGLLDALNKTAGFTLARSMDGFGASDQQSFYNKNIPVLFFFTGSHPQYHTPEDTSDLINATGESKVLELVAACAERIADTPERPTYQKVSITGSGGSPGFRVYFGSIPDYAAMVVGVQLTGVREGSPADKAGLKAGDIIIRFGDLTVKSVQDYTVALSGHKPGDVVKIVVQRGSETLTLTAKLAARKE